MARTLLASLLLLTACDRMSPADGARCRHRSLRIRCEHETTALDVGDGSRDVLWQVPVGEAPEQGWPTVILFQGSLFPTWLFWKATRGEPFGGWHQVRLTEKLLDAGYAVLTPEAQGEGLTMWNTNRLIYADDWEDSPDDQLMLAMLEAMAQGSFGPLDMDALYAAGVSSGGYMTSRMAVSYPGTFKALAIMSASYATCVGPVCQVPDDLPADHPPTLFLHGGLDKVVPVWTQRSYRHKLEDRGVEVDHHVKLMGNHGWFRAAPGDILAWFDDHR